MISLFNTATDRLEPFSPAGGKVSLYVCGVTPYDTTHLGHAFTYVSFDALIRFLEYTHFDVTYVQNVTDIDDDILRKAAELGMTYDELGDRETQRFIEDMDALGVRRPDHLVRATSVIPDIVRGIEKLVEGDMAYLSGGNVYFDTTKFPDYGDLCHCDRAHMLELAAQHGGFPDDNRKRDPLDFLLWQAQKAGEPAWPSDFGPGRPGWHIECSTIVRKFLGPSIDIHGGGRDLVFPHHASEIAEAESLTHVHPFVRTWMHTSMVRMDGEKMSKSLGNMAFVRELLTQYSASAIRLYLLSHHYRSEFEYSRDDLDEASALALAILESCGPHSWRRGLTGPVVGAMEDAMSNDLDTPAVVAQLKRLVEVARTRELAPDEAMGLRWGAHILGLEVHTPIASVMRGAE